MAFGKAKSADSNVVLYLESPNIYLVLWAKGSHSSISKHPEGARPLVQQVVREPATGTRLVVGHGVELKSCFGQLQKGTST